MKRKILTEDHEAFGRPLARLRHVRSEAAGPATGRAVTRTSVDRRTEDHASGELDAVHASTAERWATGTAGRHRGPLPPTPRRPRPHDRAPRARAFTDGRAQTVHGGTTEIVKQIIDRSPLS